MARSTTITERFEALPRSIRWLVVAGVLILLFLVWDQWVAPQVEAWNAAAEKIESRVRKVRNTEEIEASLGDLQDVIVALGAVTSPGSESKGRDALTNATTEVLDEYSVRDISFTLSGGGANLPQDISREIVRPDERLRRLTGDLRFIAKPEDAIAIISEFEQRDDIAAINSVRLTRMDEGRLKVHLILEAWSVVKKRSR